MFYNGSIYDYHFTTKQLAKEFDGQFECVGENILPFQYQLVKNDKSITCNPKFIDGFKFMNTSLSDISDNLSQIYSKIVNQNESKIVNQRYIVNETYIDVA